LIRVGAKLCREVALQNPAIDKQLYSVFPPMCIAPDVADTCMLEIPFKGIVHFEINCCYVLA